MSDDIRRFWEEVYNTFDPIMPVTDPRLRVARSPSYSPVEKVVPSIRRPFGRRTILVAGGIGSGKSTELLAVGEQLAQDHVVVLLDLWRHLSETVKDSPAIERLQPWELIGIIGLAVLRTGTERFGHDWQGTDMTFAHALAPVASDVPGASVDIAKLATGLAVALGGAAGAGTLGDPITGAAVATTGLEFIKAIGPAWSWKIGLPGSRRRGDQEQGVQSIVSATSALLKSLEEGLAGRKVVIIVDGLDRVRTREGFANLFVKSNLLRQIPCDIVVSAHLARVQDYRSQLRFDQRYDLANEPVATHGNPRQQGQGVVFFRELVQRRLDAIARQPNIDVPNEVFPNAVIDRLAWCSGGRLRDFVGFIRTIAEEAYDRASEQIGSDEIEPIIDAARRRKSDGLTKEQIALMTSIAHDPAHQLPGGELALALLNQQLILPYPNQDTWYLPHALLMLTLIRPG